MTNPVIPKLIKNPVWRNASWDDIDLKEEILNEILANTQDGKLLYLVLVLNNCPWIEFKMIERNRAYVGRILSGLKASAFSNKMFEAMSAYIIFELPKRWIEAEPMILTDARLAVEYARFIIGGRWLDAEPLILKDHFTSYLYAFHVLKERWPEAEPIIMQDPISAYHYANDVIKGRWPEAEPTLKTSVHHWERYRKMVKDTTGVLVESLVSADPIDWDDQTQKKQILESMLSGAAEGAALYAYLLVNDCPWIEFKMMRKNPSYGKKLLSRAEEPVRKSMIKSIVDHAVTIHERIPEAETLIATNAMSAFRYARDVIEARWPEAEPTIVKSTIWGPMYAVQIMKARWPELEANIRDSMTVWNGYRTLMGYAGQEVEPWTP